MRLADLERESGVAITTIKYYLREGLIPKGRTITATRSEYEDSHVTRLKLIRALVQGAGMSIAQVREIIATIENPPCGGNQFAAAQAVATPAVEADDRPEHPIVAELAEKRGWGASEKPRAMLSRAIYTMEEAGLSPDAELIGAWAEAMSEVATIDLETLRELENDAEGQISFIIAGTVTTDQALLAMRRLEQKTAARRMFPERYPNA